MEKLKVKMSIKENCDYVFSIYLEQVPTIRSTYEEPCGLYSLFNIPALDIEIKNVMHLWFTILTNS